MIPSTTSPSSSRGFTLLGILFAAAFVVVVVVGLAGLTARTFGVNRVTRHHFIAAGLAREGIELTRSLRDDNWFAHPRGATAIQWRGDGTAPVTGLGRTALCDGAWTIDPRSCPGNCGGADGPMLRPLGGAAPRGELFLTADGLYTHEGGANAPTVFRRTVTIATGGAGNGACGEIADAGGGAQPDPVTVTSRVEWEEPDGRVRDVAFTEQLFDWVRVRQ